MESEQEKDHNVADQTIEERLQTIQNSLFRHYSIEEGIALSHNWRLHQKSLLDADTFVYGEVDLRSFVSLMSNLREYEISVGENATFIDIGSGFGKLIIVATMLKLFKKAVGIEIVGSLHRRAVEMQALFIKNYRNPLDQCEMEFFNGDGTYVDWSYAPFVFVHATTFDSSMMKRITATAQKMLVDAILMIVNNR